MEGATKKKEKKRIKIKGLKSAKYIILYTYIYILKNEAMKHNAA